MRSHLSLISVCFLTTATVHVNAQASQEVYGTIVSMRGNILAVRPSLRPKMTRVVFDNKTEILTYEQMALSALRPGMRVAMGGRYSKSSGFQLFWLEAAQKPIGHLRTKTIGLQQDGGWAMAQGNLKSIQPFVFADDAGTEFTAKTDRLREVMHDMLADRNRLLIGVRIRAQGMIAPDGVLTATTIAPERNFTKEGTMFGEILGRSGDIIKVRPRYTQETISISLKQKTSFIRQITLDPDTVKQGDLVTFWGDQRNHSWDNPKSDDLKAIALLRGDLRYPGADGPTASVYLNGKLSSLEPVELTLNNGKKINVIIPAQMPVVRLETISRTELKSGKQAMLILSRNAYGAFTASTVILDASPWVGYGG